jgi:integrase/recombinase XerD
MQDAQLITVNSTSLTTINQPTQEDSRLLEMWLHGRSEHTQRAYKQDIQRLFSFTLKPVHETTLYDLQQFSDSLTDLKDSSETRILNAIKSLFSFAQDTGYLSLNVGAALRPPKVKSELAQRILTQEQAIRMISLETNPRDHAMLRLMYHCGLRVSEVVSIKWSDLQPRDEGGQVSIFGKGGKTRQVLIGADMWDELMCLDGRLVGGDRFVFQSRKGHAGTEPMDTSQVNRIVTEAAKRAGIKGNVSPHWLRHSHASHSLDRGAPINLVRETLGHASIATTGKYTHARPDASSSQFLPM